MGIVAHSVFGLTEILVRTIRYQRHQKGGYPTPPPDQLIREGIRFDPRRSLDHRVRASFSSALSLAYLGEARGPQVFQSGVVVINPKQYSALVRFLEFQGSSDAKLLLWICFRCGTRLVRTVFFHFLLHSPFHTNTLLIVLWPLL